MSEFVSPIEYLEKGWIDSELAGYTTPGWYFWDETWAYCHGPYQSKEETQVELNRYIKEVLS